ncbi:hypothetical protein BJX96DRAFT_137848 [Aspergillus floccosus]
MATSFGSDNSAVAQFASRICVQCKSSKKKCDKTLPTCNRCSRLSLPCTYDDAAETGTKDFTAQFQAIFDRLERLESRVPASEIERPSGESGQRVNLNIEANESNRSDWQLKPGLLQPSYLELIVAMNLSKILEDKGTSVRAVGEKYLDLIHDHLPAMSRERLEWRIQESERLDQNGPFLIFITSILLLTEEPADSSVASSTSSPTELYRVCKYTHSLFVSLKEPCIELIQSGVMIALYEYAQCMEDQAYLTIGTCSRMANAIGLYSAASDISQTSELTNDLEEKMSLLLGIYVVDR